MSALPNEILLAPAAPRTRPWQPWRRLIYPKRVARIGYGVDAALKDGTQTAALSPTSPQEGVAERVGASDQAAVQPLPECP
ncbi:MAG: hypothetical protein LC781_14300 [Actinobacteria bacterium]|nr:hypothetical protein [Actinomycetota bacterium]